MNRKIVIYTSGRDEYPTRMNKIEWGGGKRKEIGLAIPPRVSWRPALRASPSRGFFCNQGVATP